MRTRARVTGSQRHGLAQAQVPENLRALPAIRDARADALYRMREAQAVRCVRANLLWLAYAANDRLCPAKNGDVASRQESFTG